MENPDLMFCQHKNVCLFALLKMLTESLLTIMPCSRGPAIPPLHSACRSMAMYLVHSQEEERQHVTADRFQLCHRTGHTPAMWWWGPAWQSYGWLVLGHATEQASKLFSCPGAYLSHGRDTEIWLCYTWGHTTRKRLEQRTPSHLSKKLHYPSWMQEQAMLVYPGDDTPAFLFL